jgi:hypothetical protein
MAQGPATVPAGDSLCRVGLGLACPNYKGILPTIYRREGLEPTTQYTRTALTGSLDGISLNIQPESSQHPTNTNPSQEPLDASHSLGSSKPIDNTGSGIHSVGTNVAQSNDPTVSNPRPKYIRISGLPSSWSENDLFDALHTIDPSLTHQNCRSSLFPGCSGFTQIAVLNLDSGTEHLERHKHLKVPEPANRTVVLTIDSDFCNLTPLNVPEREIMAESVFSCATSKLHTNANVMLIVA